MAMICISCGQDQTPCWCESATSEPVEMYLPQAHEAGRWFHENAERIDAIVRGVNTAKICRWCAATGREHDIICENTELVFR